MVAAERRIRETLAKHYDKKTASARLKDWEGKPGKFQYFSPNPGAGD